MSVVSKLETADKILMKRGLCFFILFSIVGCQTYRSARNVASLGQERNISTLKNQLAPFSSQGCLRFPNFIKFENENDWKLCCVQHNVAYWKGGSSNEKSEADRRLRDCIIQKNDPNTAGIIFYGARSHDAQKNIYPLFQWGHGWSLERGDAPFNEDEKAQISELEKKIPAMADVKIQKMQIPPQHKWQKLTRDHCVDASLMFIQKHLNQTTTIQRWDETTAAEGSKFLRTIKLSSKECADPYEFKFLLNRDNACKARVPEALQHDGILLRGVTLPTQCN